jgi:Ca-activated chloride channel family protein
MAAANNLSISTAWERPLIAEQGGSATLLVRIAGSKRPHAGERRAPLDLAFVLDRSGSMAGEKLQLVKEAVTTALSLLDDHDRAALVIYDNQVERLQALTATTSRAKAAFRLALHGVDVGGSTDLAGGWLAGCDELAAAIDSGSGHRLRRALLLTDGLANVGITSEGELTHHAAELRRRGISTTALGVGEDFDEGLLSGMSEAGGGNFQFIERPKQLTKFFQDEIGELLSVVVSELTLTLDLPQGVSGRLVNAFPSTRTHRGIEVAIGNLPAGDELNLIFDLAVEPGRIGTAHMITLTLDWTDPSADRKERDDRSLPPLTVVSQVEAEHSQVDKSVQEEAAIQRGAVAQKEAMRLDRQGRYAESRAQLGFIASSLAAAPQSSRIMDMQMSAMHLAEADESSGFASSVRKRVTFDAHRRSRGKGDAPQEP